LLNDRQALARPGTAPSRTQELRDAGVTIAEVDYTDHAALTASLQGATTVVSTLQGLGDVVLGTQGALLDAAVAAHVTRFIPSDFALDFTKTQPGTNRNLDLRRTFHDRLDRSGIPQWTSILNGGFMEMLVSGQMPFINEGWHRVLHFGSADQEMDLTTMPDVAAYTAAVAVDPRPTPKFLRIAGDTFSPRELAGTMTKLRGQEYTTFWTGSLGFLDILIAVLKLVIGGTETKLFPPWQGMQYMANIVSGEGKLDPLDNDRYPELRWTTVEAAIKKADAEKAKTK
jgi:hypothetical protein